MLAYDLLVGYYTSYLRFHLAESRLTGENLTDEFFTETVLEFYSLANTFIQPEVFFVDTHLPEDFLEDLTKILLSNTDTVTQTILPLNYLVDITLAEEFFAVTLCPKGTDFEISQEIPKKQENIGK